MFRTRITELFGVEFPIIGGTMMWLSTPELTAAISEAGGLGILCSAMFREKEALRDAIRRIRELTAKPFAVNLNLFPMMSPIDNNEVIDVFVDEGIRFVETSGHRAPEEYMERLKKEGMTVVHKCVGIRYARKAASIGVDAVTVVGYENGGATGKLDIATLVLVPAVVDAVDVPVIGGGGVADGRGFLALLSLGAEGVIIGTRLLVTKECPLHPDVKAALIEATELDTRLVMRSLDATHRVWSNEAARKVVESEKGQPELNEILALVSGEKARKTMFDGELDAGVLACGQAIGLVHEELTVTEMIRGIAGKAEEMHRRLEA